MSKEEWLDVAAAAEWHDCSTKTIWRRGKNGTLPAQTEKIDGRDGRPVLKTLIRASDLDAAFGLTVHGAHVRRIRASAQPLTAEQKRALGKDLLDHVLEREEKRKRAGTGGVLAQRGPAGAHSRDRIEHSRRDRRGQDG